MSVIAPLKAITSARRARILWPPRVSQPVRAPSIWNVGPKTTLPFWLGSFGSNQNIIDLMVGTNPGASGGLDLVLTYDAPPAKFSNYAGNTLGSFPGGGHHTFLTTGKAKGFVWTFHPWCGGDNYVTPTSWPAANQMVPATAALCPTRPPTFTGAETTQERHDLQVKLWGYGADGWMDDIWRARFVAIKDGYFNRYGLRDIVIVLRAAHELSLGAGWGSRSSPRANSCAHITTLAGLQVVKAALERINDLFIDVFSNAQLSIPGDTAYPIGNLWCYFNPLSDSAMVVDASNACPDNAQIAGPDYYDLFNPSATLAQWNTSANAMQGPGRGGGPKGIISWFNWAKSQGKLFGIGEWGPWADNITGAGGDNPNFITQMLNFFEVNADDVAFACFFNRDLANSVDWPGHMIKTWPGIDTPATSCVRSPLGDNNQCAARAFREWMKLR